MTCTAEETIGLANKKAMTGLMSNNISPLIEAKRQTRLTMENQPTAANKRAHKQAVAECQKSSEKPRTSGGKGKLQKYKATLTSETCQISMLQQKKFSAPQGHQWVV